MEYLYYLNIDVLLYIFLNAGVFLKGFLII